MVVEVIAEAAENVREKVNAIFNFLHALVPPTLYPSAFIHRSLAKRSHQQIQSGPFRGMAYVEQSIGSTYLSKLLGVYELELHSLLEEICTENFDTVLNIGAAEGYYAVGLARRMPSSQIIAFESEVAGQKLIRALAEKNNVQQRVEIRGVCSPATLADSLRHSGKTLVLMDIEGAEAALLDPALAPELKRAFILVELHDSAYGPEGEPISKRFTATHTLREVWARARTPQDLPVRFSTLETLLLKKYILLAMEEYRSEKTRWFYLKPNSVEFTE